VLVGDGGFAAASLGHTCRRLQVRLVSRLLLTAQLYDPVPPQRKGKPGVKPKKGPRQPKLTQRVTNRATAWLSQEIPWYAGQKLKMDLLTGTALWHRDGEDPLPIRWVLLRDRSGKRSPFALFGTDPTLPMLQLIAWYVSRWNIEVTFLRSPHPSRPGNAATVEYAGHCTDHPVPPGIVQPRSSHSPCPPPRSFANTASRLVS
jgi:hypothetical protein